MGYIRDRKKMIFCALSLLAFVVYVFADQPQPGCNAQEAIPDNSFGVLVSAIKTASFSSDKINVVKDFVNKKLNKGFTGKQTETLIKLFTFSDDQNELIQIILPWTLGMTCAELSDVIAAQSFSSDKMASLKAIVNLVIDLK